MNQRFPGVRLQNVIYFLLMLMLLYSCILPSFPFARPDPTPTAYQEPLPPVLVEVSPLEGSQVGLNESITLYFSQPMDKESVQAALYGLPDGFLTWKDDATLTFTPGSSLEPNTEITIAILSTAQAANGLTLLEPVTLTFSTPDFLRPVSFLPEPNVGEVSSSAAVAVSFNQPVVPLGAVDDLPEAFSLAPTVEGQGEWLSTSTYIFYPEPGLGGGETYTANLNTNLVSTTGVPLDQTIGPVSWTFETSLPRLVSVEPSNEVKLALDATFKLTFNHPMDRASVEAGFSLMGPSNPVAGNFVWNDEGTEVVFEPAELLDRGSGYTLSITSQARASGGTPLALEQQYEYVTYGNFRIYSSDPTEGSLKAEGDNVQVFFSAPPKQMDNLEDLISIRPEVPSMDVYVKGSGLSISGFYLPESEYTLSISPNLLDVWGQPLGDSFELNFRTAAATSRLNMPSWARIYWVRPDEPVLYANATNIQQAKVVVAPLSFEEFQFLSDSAGHENLQSYQPQNPVTYSQTYSLAPSRSEQITLPLAPDDGVLAPGFYYTRVDSPQLGLGARDFTVSGQAAGPSYQTNLVVASHVNLAFKLDVKSALIWATDLRTNDPVSAAFTIYDDAGVELLSAQTDESGLWQGEFQAQKEMDLPYLVMMSAPGQDDFGVARSSWATGISPWDFGLSYRRRLPEPETYLYTDRPIYRPGQTVYFRGVVRQAFNGRYELPDDSSIALELSGKGGRTLKTFELPLSPYGTFHGEYQLSAEAEPGYYTLRNREIGAYLYFDVAEYRKPEIELDAAFVEEQLEAGEQLQAESDAGYYFGSPAGDIEVQWSLYGRSTYFHLPGYRTGVFDDGWLRPYWARYGSFGRTLESGTARTEADGSLTMEFSEIPKSESPQSLTLEVTAQDESGFPVSARATTIVHPADFYVGLRPDQWIGQSERAMGFEVLTADWERNPSPSRALQAEFKQVEWVRKDPPQELQYHFPTYEPVYTLVGSSNLSTGPDGKARLSFTPPQPGTYVLDVFDDQARSQVLLWVRGGGSAAWPRLMNDQLVLTADQEGYQPGETAQIFVPNPFGERVPALVSVERGKVLSAEVITLEPSGSSYSLELTDEHAPNVYLSTTLLGPDNQFRQGYATLDVEPSAQELQVELVADPEVNEPRGEMTVRVRVTDREGNPVEGEFSLSVVDKAVLALADPNSIDILPAFYGTQSLGVSTGLSLTLYSGRYIAQPGGGGGGGGGGDVVTVREQFPDTAYWNPTFVTDANGEGVARVTLPDNLTTWFIETRGLTVDMRVGQANTEVVTTKPLLVRPVTPRFMVAGDHVQLAAIVHNNTEKPMEATVRLQADTFILDEGQDSDQSVEIPAQGRIRVSWWGKAQGPGEAELVFQVNGSNGEKTLQDAAKPTLGPIPIRAYTAPQTFVTAGTMVDAGSRQEVIGLPRSFSPIGGGLDVELSPSLAASLLNSLEALPTPSCTCNSEAVLSYFLPNLEIYRALQASGLDDAELKARLDESLDDGITALIRNQNTDGGWGWIRGSDSDENITAYVLFGLARARIAGLSIPDTVFEMGYAYVQEGLLTGVAADRLSAWELDRLTFAIFAIQQGGGLQETEFHLLNSLHELRDRLSPWAQALLALSIESAFPGDPRAENLISNLQATAVRTASSANWESENASWRNPGTPLYNTAVVVYALAQRSPTAPVLIDAVRYLSANQDANGSWRSSYETAWVILALTEVMKGFGELQADFAFSATVNGAPLVSGEASGSEILTPVSAGVPIEYLSTTAPNALTISRESGLGRLYYRISLLLNRQVETVQPLNKGMSLRRAYFDGTCEEDCAPLTTLELASDSRITARLTLTLPNDSYYVTVEDYIPAGTEILNQRLKTSQQGEETTSVQVVYDPDDPFGRGWGWWYFNDPQIHDDRISWTANYLPAGTYELTYTMIPTLAGEFRVLPAHAWQTFFPDVQGTGAGSIFEIIP